MTTAAPVCDAQIDREAGATNHIDLRLLSQFTLVCETGSMSAAARRLGISTAAVSQAIARLERDFGVVLLNRAGSTLRTTPAGSVLRERAKRLIAEANNISDELSAFQSRTIPKLNMYVVESAASYVIAPLVSFLNGSVGDLSINSTLGTNYVEDFLRGATDIIVSTEALADIETIERHPICTENLVALVPASVPQELRRIEVLQEQLPFLSISRGRRRTAALVEDYLERHDLDPTRRIECSVAAPILELIGGGFGWTITTPMSVGYLRPSPDKIAWVPLDSPESRRTLYLLAAQDRFSNFPEMLANFCRNALKEEVTKWRVEIGVEATAAIDVTSETNPGWQGRRGSSASTPRDAE